jgi:tRNA nucleotidyltransferase (CCA-adding enzyme)
MKIYLVGGAVRDQLLGLPVSERDWVVVGGSAQALLAQGYTPVGKDFPVFLHPQTQEEYALARQERKTAPGYAGFSFDTQASVSLEEDLARRDLTINAMAMDDQGRLIDPYGGKQDLEQRLLRHVSDAFIEDPVRILRIARFAARFAPLGFRIADSTLALMQRMVADGEVDHLVPERVWKELQRALMESEPQVFLTSLRQCGALKALLPEVDALFGVPQHPDHHPEIDTGLHSLMALKQAQRLNASLGARFAVLVHDLGKAQTPPEHWPRHPGHETRAAPLISQLCQRMAVPKDLQQLAQAVARWHTQCHKARQLNAQDLFELLQGLDAFRQPERLKEVCCSCEADARGREGFADSPYPQGQYLQDALSSCYKIDTAPLLEKGLQGPALGQAITQERVARLDAFIQAQRRT